MAITRLNSTGLEWQDVALEFDSVTGTVEASSDVSKSGSWSLHYTSTASEAYGAWVFSPIAQARTSFHIRNSSVSGTSTPDLFSLFDGTSPIMRIRFNADGEFLAVAGASTNLSTVTHIPFMSNPLWFHISIDVRIDAVDGWVRLYVDGTQIIDYSGDTTQGGSDFNSARYGNTTSGTIGRWDSPFPYWDDIYLDDTTGEVSPTFAPDRRFLMINPAGNGQYSQWTGSDGNSTDNFLLVDDVPEDGDDTYVRATSTSILDTYEMTSFTIPTGWAVEALIKQAVARKEDAGGTIDIDIVDRLDTTDRNSSSFELGTDYALYSDRQTTKPTGGAWDQTSLDGIQVGVETQ